MGGRVPLFGRNSWPVRSAENAVFQLFPTPCGFRMHRGKRRSAMRSQFQSLMISLFENLKVCHDVFSRSERLRANGEYRMANGTRNGTICYSPFAIWSNPIAPCQVSKCLKTLKMARAGYWLELAWIWDRRHVRFGSAPFCWPRWIRQIRRCGSCHVGARIRVG
jgi:hypothetical protein